MPVLLPKADSVVSNLTLGGNELATSQTRVENLADSDWVTERIGYAEVDPVGLGCRLVGDVDAAVQGVSGPQQTAMLVSRRIRFHRHSLASPALRGQRIHPMLHVQQLCAEHGQQCYRRGSSGGPNAAASDRAA
jgi:hypothetical protein